MYDIEWMRLAISKRPNRVGVSLLSPEDGNRSILRNAVFSIYLELRTIDKVHKPSDSVCYTPSAALFILYFCAIYLPRKYTNYGKYNWENKVGYFKKCLEWCEDIFAEISQITQRRDLPKEQKRSTTYFDPKCFSWKVKQEQDGVLLTSWIWASCKTP
jgi:hypothetical protein